VHFLFQSITAEWINGQVLRYAEMGKCCVEQLWRDVCYVGRTTLRFEQLMVYPEQT